MSLKDIHCLTSDVKITLACTHWERNSAQCYRCKSPSRGYSYDPSWDTSIPPPTSRCVYFHHSLCFSLPVTQLGYCSCFGPSYLRVLAQPSYCSSVWAYRSTDKGAVWNSVLHPSVQSPFWFMSQSLALAMWPRKSNNRPSCIATWAGSTNYSWWSIAAAVHQYLQSLWFGPESWHFHGSGKYLPLFTAGCNSNPPMLCFPPL